jgi:hypothetical protein
MDIMSEIKDITYLGQGNPGALTVVRDIFALGIPGIEILQTLTKLEIRGPLLWILYKQVCKYNLQKMCTILTAYNNGALSSDIIIHAINNEGDGIDITNY